MIRATVRRANRSRPCGGCYGSIAKGERYIEHVMSPYHQGLNGSRWTRMAECARCADRYGRTVEAR